MSAGAEPHRHRPAALAAVLYLGVALWAARVVLPAPASTFPYPARLEGREFLVFEQGDQQFVASALAGNARRLVAEPWRLFESGFCHPMPHAVTLGEHMFGNGLLAIPAYLLTRDPVLTTNVVVILTLWLPALSMYALVRHWTGSAAAAFVAGLLFAFHPNRVIDPAHPFVHGNQWTPLALLFAHRLFARRRWRDAAGLVLFVGLQLLESFYQVVALGVLGGIYGLYLLVRYRHALGELAPKLLACGAAIGTLTLLVLGPYLRAQAAWGIAGRNFSYLNYLYQFRLGESAYPGSVVLLLAAVALLDRLRGPRRAEGYDPRLIYLTAGLVLLWTVLYVVPLPLLGINLPSLSRYLRVVVPGLDAGRALAIARHGVYLVAAFLAGYGVLAVTERWGKRARLVATAILSSAAVAEVFWPPLARYSFGSSVEWRAYHVRPPADLLALYDTMETGPVLDVPMSRALPGALGEYVFLAGYHGRAVAACYNSYTVPVVQDVEALASRLPDTRAVEALHALGFRTLVVHEERLLPRRRETLASAIGAGDSLSPIGRSGSHAAFRLASRTPVDARLAALAPAPAPTVDVAPPVGRVRFAFANRGEVVYRHPDPIEPTPLLVRWQTPPGQVAVESRIDRLLPLALAPGERAVRSFEVPVPEIEGEYEVTLAPASTPDLVIARQPVRVVVRHGAPS